MNAFRLVTFIGIVVVAMIAIQASAALSPADPLSGAMFMIDLEPSLPMLLGLAALIPFAMTGRGLPQHAAWRRRVNRARLRARRAAA
jgi:hypothetical protein